MAGKMMMADKNGMKMDTAVTCMQSSCDELRTAVCALGQKWADALKMKDFKALSALYCMDSHLLPNGAPAQEGREAIAKYFETAVSQMMIDSVKLDIGEVGMIGSDSGYERSSYTFMKKDGSVADRGKYLVIYKKEKGMWMIHSDIFSSNGPEMKMEDTGKALDAVYMNFQKAFAAADAQGVADCYDVEGVLLAPFAPPQTGREAIMNFCKGSLAAGVGKIEIHTLERQVGDDMASDRNTFKFYAKDGKTVVSAGNSITVLKKRGGVWRFYRDACVATSMPAAPAAAM